MRPLSKAIIAAVAYERRQEGIALFAQIVRRRRRRRRQLQLASINPSIDRRDDRVTHIVHSFDR